MLSAKMKILQAICCELEYSPISARVLLVRSRVTYLGVDSAAHTVGQLGVQLGQLVLGVHTRVGDVPHGGSLHDVPDDELLDGFVLGAGLGAVGAPHELDVATTVLVAAVVTALGGHL